MADYQKSYKNIILKGCFRALIMLLIMEGLLYLGGFVQLSIQSYTNKVERKKSKEFRILCIGGSTTYYGGLGESYPNQLEKILNERQEDVQFRVINKGLPAKGTTQILYELEENLIKFEPDMVIALMGGANEGGLMKTVADTPIARFKFLFLDRIKTYRLLKKLNSDAVTYLKNYKVSKKISTDFFKNSKNKSKLEDIHSSHNDFNLTEIGRDDKVQNQLNINSIMNENEQALNEVKNSNEQSNERINKTSIKTHEKSLEHYKSEYKMITEYHPLTVRNINDISEMIINRGIRLIFMQYALMDVEPLKEIIYYREKIIFVSNKSNFENAIQYKSYEEYVTDHWGHLSPLGNALIARTLAPIIFNEAGKLKAK